jgi:hypothetical protein
MICSILALAYHVSIQNGILWALQEAQGMILGHTSRGVSNANHNQKIRRNHSHWRAYLNKDFGD